MKYFAPRSFYYYEVLGTKQQFSPVNSQAYFKILLLVFTSLSLTAQAENYPNLNADGEFSLMGALANHSLHNLQDERWNLYSQGTYITSYHPSFPAAYTNLNNTPN